MYALIERRTRVLPAVTHPAEALFRYIHTYVQQSNKYVGIRHVFLEGACDLAMMCL